ncbi:MAG: DNA replication/repair protein RecF [Pseudomonadales bacterium]|jgi:DNA replication and repair protein RecF|nr:DNA replication/repair protein RecF [Pseudomonadales bacterium]
MTQLARLYIQGLRNITEADFQPCSHLNLLLGENGSGKTSVLEAVYMLGTGRSFRGHLQRPLIQEGQALCSVYGELEAGVSLGIQRGRQGIQTLKVGGTQADSASQLSQALPLLLLNSDTFAILEGSPTERRRFIDWGVFHVKHEFLRHWKIARQALKQRNQLLRQEAPVVELAPWTQALAGHAQEMHLLRADYLRQFEAHLWPLLGDLLGEELAARFTMDYLPGWDVEQSLETQLHHALPRDRQHGHTTVGPHRAELRLRWGGQDVASVLSRGQMKLLICALRLGQASLLQLLSGTGCVLLIDDLPAELDGANRGRVCVQLERLALQTFMTCIEPEALLPALQASSEKAGGVAPRLFHVKRGRIETQL